MVGALSRLSVNCRSFTMDLHKAAFLLVAVISTVGSTVVPEVTCVVGEGDTYRGKISWTWSGKTCQRWSSQTPHQHSRTTSNYPNKGLESNYCRNPDGTELPWCYTTDPDTRWQYCSVPRCVNSPGPEECMLYNGESYRGKIHTTQNGVTCQRWDSQTPHKHDYTPSAHPEKPLEENYCRNLGGEPRPWCFTTNPSKRWDYCAVPLCLNPTVVSHLTCANGDGEAYRGSISWTWSGKTCQSWSSQTPHQHSRTTSNYPNKGLESNYCRNPDGTELPWCYTTDPDTRWQYCSVPRCVNSPGPEECIHCNGLDYKGKIHTTQNGFTCQRWDSQTPHEHSYSPSAHPEKNLEENYCRNPSGDPQPWCFTTDPSKRWDFCSVPRCTSEPPTIVPEQICTTGRGQAYRGTIAVTESGRTCQSWSSQTPHQHNRTPENYPCNDLDNNYCRNPDNEKRPWCYTTDPDSRWEYCNVPSCEN
ncbi:plasminogen-like [Betta splendens]|uniref:Plasminogen-like n=1 Tax=Betta splendens TaxID=158456 RepID=A0A6P7LRL4_BETSP|nr:plasminogen-like [Betta splendens]